MGGQVGAGRILIHGEYVGKEYTPENNFEELLQFIGVGDKGYLNLCGVSRVYWGEYTSLAGASMLGTPHSHEEESQMLLDMIF